MVLGVVLRAACGAMQGGDETVDSEEGGIAILDADAGSQHLGYRSLKPQSSSGSKPRVPLIAADHIIARGKT